MNAGTVSMVVNNEAPSHHIDYIQNIHQFLVINPKYIWIVETNIHP